MSVTVRKLRATVRGRARCREPGGGGHPEDPAPGTTCRRATCRQTAVSVSRERVRRRGHQAQTRYRAFTELEVRTRASHISGRCSTRSQLAGADDVIGPDFSFADPSAAQIIATRRALADARRRADDAAAQLGSHVTGIASVDLDPSFGGVVESSGESGPSGAAGAGTRLSPGREENCSHRPRRLHPRRLTPRSRRGARAGCRRPPSSARWLQHEVGRAAQQRLDLRAVAEHLRDWLRRAYGLVVRSRSRSTRTGSGAVSSTR